MRRTSVFYLLLLAVVGAAIAGVLHLGQSLPAPAGVVNQAAVERHAPGADPLARLFLQLLVILLASRVFGALFVRLGQPAVVGEMAAGIVLGPSLFGWLVPPAFDVVFPAHSLEALKFLSQLGVCLFMFVVGMELDLGHLRGRTHTAVVVSHASIVVPYFLGVCLAWFLFARLAAPGATFTAFALFLGISMSITAFPVLARILQERGLSRTSLGSLALTCAAVDDVTAWSLLALVVAIAGSADLLGSGFRLVLVLGFVALMVGVVRPLLARRLAGAGTEPHGLSSNSLALVLVVLLASALATEWIGIHALFGAFLAGAVMPEADGFRGRLALRIEQISAVLLLPVFFAFTGLRTQMGLLNSWTDFAITLGIVGVATVGKFGGSALAARFAGVSWAESFQLGALMNTRGLMELIALNIGYDLGILSPRIFSMLVVMALVTTVMTGPLLNFFRRFAVPWMPITTPVGSG